MTPQEKMIGEIRKVYGLKAPLVLSAMLRVKRRPFVPKRQSSLAYSDCALPIGYGQTISQPYTVAFMTNLCLKTGKKEKVLEIGTGSGYQAALLSKLFKKVYSIEIIPQLAKKAKQTLKTLGFKNIFVKEGSGEKGWEKHSPFDAILITAGISKKVPSKLFDQLTKGGVLVAPVGEGRDKTMIQYVKDKRGKIKIKKHGIFHFVPFID